MSVLSRVFSVSLSPASWPRRLLNQTLLGLTATAGIATLGASAWAAGCHAPSDVHSAFEIAGLRSELMVTALSCQKQDNYNAFVAKFRPALLNADKRLQSYFQTTYGRQGTKMRDDYVTQLADVQSLGGLKSGTIFCDQRVPMFEEVQGLDTPADLAHYAEAKDILQPTSYENCEAPKASGSELTRKSSRHGRHAVRHHVKRRS